MKEHNHKNKEHGENNQQELIYRLAMYEQQIRQLREQLQAVEQGVSEISILNLGLDDLKSGRDKDILASVGKGIFAEAKLTSDKLIVDVGNKNFVKKTIPETQETIREQITKLNDVKKELNEHLEMYTKEMRKMLEDFRGED